MIKSFILILGNISIIFSALAQDYTTQKDITNKVIGYFEQDQTSEIYALFDETMQSAITIEKLSEIWKTLPTQVGKYIGSGEAVASEVQGLVVVNHFLDFENVDLDLKLAFNEQNQISGLFFVPAAKKKSR